MKRDKLLKLPGLKEKYEKNPFVVELTGKMFLQPRANAIISKGQGIVDINTGEIINESVLIGRRKIVDKSEFAKIYASEICELFDLSKTAINVFLHLSKVMDYDNRAYFNYRREYNKLSYTAHTAPLKGLRELIQRNIIACDIREHTYWLNPTIVCKGERFAKYTEFILDKTGETELKAQGRDMFNKMPEEVENKLNKMNKTEEDKHRKQMRLYDSGLDPVE